MKKKSRFTFKPFSKKQRMILNWWTSDSPVKGFDGIIADGSIRSGKTICMSLSFVIWAMDNFETQSFGMCGKTIGSFRRNVLFWLKLMLFGRGYQVKDRRSDNLLEITDRRTKVVNYFYIFGGRDEASQDLVQGITLAGAFFDEVALMPESFVNQATGRCSVEGAKLWFNCNPDNPEHYFKKKWIDDRKNKKLLYVHFTMDDNLSLSDKVKERYRRMYSGVFFKRFIQGLWVAAEGVLFPQLANEPEKWEIEHLPKAFKIVNVGVDIGGTNSHTPIIATGITQGFKEVITFKEKNIKHAKGTVDIDIIADKLIEMVRECVKEGYYPKYILVDNAEQVILNTLRKSVINARYSSKVIDCKKYESITRIQMYNLLLNTDRMKFYQTPMVLKSLSSVIYDQKAVLRTGKDKVLDNGTTDMDTYDAHFYSWSIYAEYLGIAKGNEVKKEDDRCLQDFK